eukprot:GILI01003430.1.p1 GENE.GILI01003430.1~~GILI01003430.1.p1  ORF type:complete len:584 (+),score=152.36 GILI01003430.1:45-1796(+)
MSTGRKTTRSAPGEEDLEYFVEPVELSDDDDGDFNYEEVEELEDDDEEDDDLDDIEKLLSKARASDHDARRQQDLRPKAKVTERPCLVDDFIRNFLVKNEMHRTLDSFQSEYYELQAKGKIREGDVGAVPDVYLQNDTLQSQLSGIREQLSAAQEVAEKAKSTWDKFRKERDFHRMHHRRVVQEKNKLITDLKRLKKHYDQYEPTLRELRNKYEVAMKEKMLMRLERDRLQAKLDSMQATLTQLEQAQANLDDKDKGAGKTQRRKGKDSAWPSDDRSNPYLNTTFETPVVEQFTLQKTFKGHMMTISSVALHPRKPILATVSDDYTWKMWSMPNGELIMSGEGHKDWVSGVDFHPRGTHLATSSGDGTVKVWDFVNACCTSTFSDHTQAVWGVAFHDSGDFLVSCSMDHTSKLWDLNSSRCRQTFRGHVDSVNHVCFQPFSNNLCTGSGDKTVSLWDLRSGLCIQTFYGHMNAVNHVSFNVRGDTIASCDADGIVKLWDVRMVTEKMHIDAGQHPVNAANFDRSGRVLSIASGDGSVKLHNLLEDRTVAVFVGHDDSVQDVVFDPNGKFVVSCGADCTFRVWS